MSAIIQINHAMDEIARAFSRQRHNIIREDLAKAMRELERAVHEIQTIRYPSVGNDELDEEIDAAHRAGGWHELDEQRGE